MSTLKLSILLFLCVVLSSCSQVTPFEDRQREPGTERIWRGDSKPDAPVVCYNPLFYDQEDIIDISNNLCQNYKNDTHAELTNIDYFSCRLFVPAKAYYKCVTNK